MADGEDCTSRSEDRPAGDNLADGVFRQPASSVLTVHWVSAVKYYSSLLSLCKGRCWDAEETLPEKWKLCYCGATLCRSLYLLA